MNEQSQNLAQQYDKDGLLTDNTAHWYACQSNVNNEDAAKKISYKLRFKE